MIALGVLLDVIIALHTQACWFRTSRGAPPRLTRTGVLRGFALIVLTLCSTASARAGQVTALVAPGPLSKAHANLEGVGKCTLCHEPGHTSSAARCLNCHEPIARRMARKAGVHRAVTDNCTPCHVEHRGADADLRRIDAQKFDHFAETGFVLEGRHASPGVKCASCHTTRSFLQARTACSTCHKDVHKNNLGSTCTPCHVPETPFKETRNVFDHTKATFLLTGAHVTVKCEACHKNGVFRGLTFSTCASCHTEPHKTRFGDACTSCHTTERWMTRTVEHARAAFPLVGAHAKVACAGCHVSRKMTAPLRFDQCSACHVNVHRDSLKEDCKACHTESTFRGAPFDHARRTRFALDGKHVGLECAKCHTGLSSSEVPLARKVIDFGGAGNTCVACHGPKDPHKGEFGRVCDSCHRTATFGVKAFKHPGVPEFYLGSHEKVVCDKCHVPGRTPIGTGPSHPTPACASCHRDVHLGQVGAACESCHSVDGAQFKAAKFAHARTTFALTGKHETTDCAKCHRTDTRTFPAGHGTAMMLKPMDTQCKACHTDPHLGQVDTKCETCHQTAAFKLPTFTHKGLEDFFAGFHGKYRCVVCHKNETGAFPAGRGTAVRLLVGRTCVGCHPF